MPERKIMTLADANYLIKETVIQTNYSAKECVKLLRIVNPYYKAKLTSNNEIEIDDDE
jgi:hypothetical protein